MAYSIEDSLPPRAQVANDQELRNRGSTQRIGQRATRGAGRGAEFKPAAVKRTAAAGIGVILILVVFAALAFQIPPESGTVQPYPINTGIVPSRTPVPSHFIHLPVILKESRR